MVIRTARQNLPDQSISTQPPLTSIPQPHEKEITMFIAFAIILAIAWILGFGVFHVASTAIHVLVLLAIVSVVLHFVRGQKRTT
jgi:Family of unknown function (DUF5670)